MINLTTISAIGREIEQSLDTRRFRANIFIETDSPEPFMENHWMSCVLIRIMQALMEQ